MSDQIPPYYPGHSFLGAAIKSVSTNPAAVDASPVLLNALEVLCARTLSFGDAAPSEKVSRVVGSCGRDLPSALAAGLLTMGERHAPVADAAVVVESFTKCPLTVSFPAGAIIPGLGHPFHKMFDPRVQEIADIFELRNDETLRGCPLGCYIKGLWRMEKYGLGLGTHGVPLNVAALIAALGLSLGLPTALTPLPLIVSRLFGMAKAHAFGARGPMDVSVSQNQDSTR